jgi:hypothetical protein
MNGPRVVLCLALAACTACSGASSARAGTLPVVFGRSWDGDANSLQRIVDARYGVGKINVQTDYIGAHPGDLDPWFWVDDHFTAIIVREVAGNANRNMLGWYLETDTRPQLTANLVSDGLVFDGPSGTDANMAVLFPRPLTKFGFYLNPNGTGDAVNAPEPEVFFTNRFYNDAGPSGTAALHLPSNGDVQALIFDVSAWTAPNTWLVCFEDLDSGAAPGDPGQSQTDNDFNDFVFEVHALGATPVAPVSFGEIKRRYR